MIINTNQAQSALKSQNNGIMELPCDIAAALIEILVISEGILMRGDITAEDKEDIRSCGNIVSAWLEG